MIECRNITKIYKTGHDEAVVLKNVSFDIKDSEFIAIMGPSGSGKSTLMHILGALDTPTSGTYKLYDKEVAQLSDDELAEIRRDKIGFVFQAFNLLPRATALRNVGLPLIYANLSRKERDARAAQALTSANLPTDHWNHLTNQLSGGQMQRVAIARALVNNPKIILADEPTGNLDSKTGDYVLETFQRLNEREGRTIVLITHEHDVAAHAKRIIYIRDGQIYKDETNKARRITKTT